MKISQLIDTKEDIEVFGISYDSRKTKKGDVFVAIKGFKTDGHEYAKTAQDRGAACVVCERDIPGLSIPCIKVENTRVALAQISHRFYNNPSEKINLIGVTGTNGKTTVTYLLKEILEKSGHKVGLIGTNQNMIGDRVIKTERTTPEALELAQLFCEMVNEGCDYIVMEVSSHSLELHRVDFCRFDVGIFTNLSQDHLDFHGDMENYANAKLKLFDMCKIGIINLDDPRGDRFADAVQGKLFTYGVQKGAIRAENVIADIGGITFDTLKERINVAIPGRFSVYNALAAIACAHALGIDIQTIKKALLGARGVRGRMELVPAEGDFAVVIDYAHTPDGLENVLKSIKEFTKGRLIAVFGCGGDRDRTKRPKMGQIAGELADVCVVTSDNPRSESPIGIINDILAGMDRAEAEIVVIENRYEAIEHAINIASEGDVVLLAGKGHETYQVLADRTIHFDEREVVAKILEGRR
ncbi:MAG: UDP-N-acetylmuramoyl-L-alanyl-D-glutamate--2,6-diaminopimelate ligase [Eubacteriales bacterium]|jgi:UDP-N-acetylmuramoyl-L-alanyl-D-glutamate--2,6-diaminopimelate ligase|nr:UDP-N-acetylmuramoyl-L-alanyl-D-glutamate--2,6-diaminopimelate ligase [Eubacteriales bacterium]